MQQTLQNLLSGDLTSLFLAALVFFVIVALFMGVRFMFASRVDVIGERMKRSVAYRDSTIPPPSVIETGQDVNGSLISKTAKGVASVAKPMNEEEMGRLREKLSHAGFRGERAVFNYLAVKVVLSLSMAGGLVWFNTTRPQPLQYLLFFILLAMMVGFYFPSLWLQSKISKRQNVRRNCRPGCL